VTQRSERQPDHRFVEVLGRIFGWEVTGGWRKIHNEEVHYLYSSPSITVIIK
jgi:hypothetical protein